MTDDRRLRATTGLGDLLLGFDFFFFSSFPFDFFDFSVFFTLAFRLGVQDLEESLEDVLESRDLLPWAMFIDTLTLPELDSWFLSSQLRLSLTGRREDLP